MKSGSACCLRGNFFCYGMIVLILIAGLMGCGGKTTVRQDQTCKQASPGVTVQASLDRLYRAVQLNPDGTVSFNERGTGFVSLTAADKAFGKVLLAVLNQKIAQGLVRVNNDFSTQWTGPKPSEKALQGGSCNTHWWGETCNVNAATTKKTCVGLRAGDGALMICSLIPVVDAACEIIEVVGAIPLEAEICPCADKSDSSTFHVTWAGVAWFTCN
jgi:hypothetical protein